MGIDQLPKCLCIADAPNPIERTSWKGGGGSFSPTGTDRHYECDLCTRRSIEIYRPGGNLFIINPTQADIDYINVTLDRIWRDRETAIRRWRDDQETKVIADDEADARQRGARKVYGPSAYWKPSGIDAFHGWVYRKVRKDAAPWARETLLTDHIICAVERASP